MYKLGDHVVYHGHFWDIYSFETDQEGYLSVVLIDPNYNAENGEPEPTVYVRDLSGITRAQSVAA